MNADEYARADAVRCEAYGVLRLMRGCGVEHVRGQDIRVWSLRYAVAAHMMALAGPAPERTTERQAA